MYVVHIKLIRLVKSKLYRTSNSVHYMHIYTYKFPKYTHVVNALRVTDDAILLLRSLTDCLQVMQLTPFVCMLYVSLTE